MNTIFLSAAVVAVALGLLSAMLLMSKGPPSRAACETDYDCVPAQCCHPTSCTGRGSAPDCTNTACTTECRKGTMDCGQGRCSCVNKECRVIWNG